MLIENGADVNHRDNEGNTPLLLATRAGHEGVVRVLAGYCIDKNATGPAGKTAVELAREKGFERILEYLQKPSPCN